MKNDKNKRGNADQKIRVIPLGGLEQIGMNITAFEYGDSIVVVDCGLSFPADDMLGIDLVIPDVSYLVANKDRVKAFMITHGHEDHIGALPYVLKEINVPVFATTLTMGIIEHKLKEHEMEDIVTRHTVQFGDALAGLPGECAADYTRKGCIDGGGRTAGLADNSGTDQFIHSHSPGNSHSSLKYICNYKGICYVSQGKAGNSPQILGIGRPIMTIFAGEDRYNE